MIAALLALVPLFQSDPELERLGTSFLAEVVARGPAPSSSRLPEEARFMEQLAELHHRVRLGGFEVWIPKATQSSDASFGRGLDPRDARPWARQLIELERTWFDHLDIDGDQRAELDAAFEKIRAQVESLGTGDIAPPDAELDAAHLSVGRVFPHATATRPPVLIIAPTRAHFLGLFGAAGLGVPTQQHRLWTPGLRRNVFAWLFWEVLALPLEEAIHDDVRTLIAARHDDAQILETIVHRCSHLLAERAIPAAPEWFIEGLAMHDTISLTGDDDSLCTGFSQRERIQGGAAAFEWIEANMSPYREGAASRWFDKELKPDREGWFEIHDLDTGRSGLRLRGPFLGARAHIPDTVVSGPKGLQNGYAEFFRAYSGAFVHYLSQLRVGTRPVTKWLIGFMRDPERLKTVSEQELAPVGLRMITMKTLGLSDDPERDLEAAFTRWLQTGK
jgi:hypothetical protein